MAQVLPSPTIPVPNLHGEAADPADKDAGLVSETPSEPIAFTVMSKSNGHLTKMVSLSEDGTRIVKDGSYCRMSLGTAHRAEAKSLSETGEILNGLGPNQAITLGVFADDLAQAEIVSKAASRDGARTRTKGGSEGFVFHADRPALLLIDIDLDGHLDGYDGTVESGWNWLTGRLPWLSGVGYLGRPSTSSGIYLGYRRLDDPQKAGLHIYIGVQDGAEIPQILKKIDDHLWHKGFGYIKISSSGQRLYRTPVDATVGSPERLVFEAPPLLSGGITQAERCFTVVEGRLLLPSDVPMISLLDKIALEDTRRRAYGDAEPAAKRKREEWKERRQGELVARYVAGGLSDADARAAASRDITSWLGAVLQGSVLLQVEGGEVGSHEEQSVTVDTLYETPTEWDGCYCRDPDEPEKGPQKARLALDSQGWLTVYSWVGGGKSYLLRPSASGVLHRLSRWSVLSSEQRTALLRDCGRVDVDEAGLIPISEAAVAATGYRRAEIKRILTQARKEAKAVLSAHATPARERVSDLRRFIDEKATHVEIALDARLALTAEGVAPVFGGGALHVYEQGTWRAVDEAMLKTWIGLSYGTAALVKRNSEIAAVMDALYNACSNRDFFDNTRPGAAVGQEFWTVSTSGALSSEPLRPGHGARFQLPFPPDFSKAEPKMLGELFTMVFEPKDRDDLAFSVGALMGCAILGLGHVFKEAGFLIGAGDTGKSTLGALLSQFLPAGAVAAIPLGKMGHEYSLAQLSGARLNLPGEEASDVVIPASALKQITGGDPLSARLPYGRPFSFVSRALQLFTANKMPPLREHELQVYRRIVFIPFTREIPTEKRIGKTEIAAKKMFDAEGPQILGWALRCAARAVSVGTMQTRATMEASKQWRKAEDSVLDAFMGSESCFTITGSAEDRLAASLAFQDYQRFTQDAGRKPLGRNQFYDRINSSQDLSAVGVTIVEDRKGQKFITGVRDQREQFNRGIAQLRASMPKPDEPEE